MGTKRFVHLSGLGADASSPSPYIRSRGEGDAAVQTEFLGSVVIRAAVMFAPDDAFLTIILGLLDPCQRIRCSATGGRGSSYRTRTTLLRRSQKSCDTAKQSLEKTAFIMGCVVGEIAWRGVLFILSFYFKTGANKLVDLIVELRLPLGKLMIDVVARISVPNEPSIPFTKREAPPSSRVAVRPVNRPWPHPSYRSYDQHCRCLG